MPTTLSRLSNISSSGTPWQCIHVPDFQNMSAFYYLLPTEYSKPLSEMTESEIYSNKSGFECASKNFYTIRDSSTNATTGIKIATVFTNTDTQDKVINGTRFQLKYSPSSSSTYYYNLILTKFDSDIIVAPSESYQFTLDLDNLFQSFPATIGS